MRFTVIRALVAALLIGVALPGAALAQVAAPPDRLLGPLSIRISGGFMVGIQFAQFSAIGVRGFIASAGVAFPIADRDDMEIQVDASYLDYSGHYNPGGGQSISGRIVAPTATFLYNFVREGRRVMPFVGGGANLAHIDETRVRNFSNPFFPSGTAQHTTRGWFVGLQAVGGVQFASQSRVPFRVEGRLNLGPTGVTFGTLGGISF